MSGRERDDDLEEFGLDGDGDGPRAPSSTTSSRTVDVKPTPAPTPTPAPMYHSSIGYEPIAEDPDLSLGQGLVGGPIDGDRAAPDLPSLDNYDVLGAALTQSPAFQQLLAKRAAAGSPVMRKQPMARSRDYDYPLGPLQGQAGEVKTITATPQCYFRVDKMMATDSATPPGSGTAIRNFMIGQRAQRPSTPVPTMFFAANALGGVKFDTCPPSMSISLDIEFIKTCTFTGHLFGKALT